MQINQQEQKKIYDQYWLPMEQLLGDNLTEFIRHYLTKNGILVKKNEVYFKLKDMMSSDDTISCLKDIYTHSQYYAQFLNPELETNKNIRKHLDRIKRLDVATVYPFLLNCFSDWQSKKISELELLEICKILENYVLRRFVCDIQTRGLNQIFALLYTKISKEINLESANFVQTLKKVLSLQKYPQDNLFKEKLVTVTLYGSNRTEKGRLVLESLEENFAHKEKVSIEELSIEHIMPQTLNDKWKNHLGEDYEITHELLLHTLGNITLTGYNSQLSNSSFSVKKESLSKSHLELNQYFKKVKCWQKDNIEKRAEILANMALEIWSYFGDYSSKSYGKTKVKGATPQSLKMFDQIYAVKSWRDVLETTLNLIADYDSDKFQEIITQFPRFLGWDNRGFRETRQLKNGAYVNVNLSGKDIYTFCQKAIEIGDLSSEDRVIETR
jgi:hypothetical protein